MTQPLIKITALDTFPGANKVVVTDAAGNVNFTSTLQVGGFNVLTYNSSGTAGNLSVGGSATSLTTARNINGVSFNGTADITIADATKVLKAGDTMTGNLTVPTVIGALSGNATTGTTFQTARTINGVSFNGSANITINAVDATPRVALAGDTMTGALTATQFNGSGAGLTGTAGSLNIGGNAATATNSTNATNAAKLLVNGGYRDFQYAGQSGQPTWLWGTNDGVTIQVWNPVNFSVASASTASTASSAAKLTTARTINGVNFDGTAPITINAVDATPRVAKTGDTMSGNLTAPNFIGALSGNATTATTLQTARTINGVSFNGSANITVLDGTKLSVVAASAPYITGDGTPGNPLTISVSAIASAIFSGLTCPQIATILAASNSCGTPFYEAAVGGVGVVGVGGG